MSPIAYESAGQGTPLVMLHAFPLSSKMWKAQMQSLSKNFRVIAPDIPGLGSSPVQHVPSIALTAVELTRILDGLEIKEPVILVGLSMGGYAALEFVRQFPKRVRGLGLFSTKAGADSPEGREKRLKTIESIKTEGMEAFAAATVKNLIGKTTLETKPEVAEGVTQMILENKSKGVCDALLAMAERRDSTEILSGIQCPVLIIAGSEDTVIPVSEAEGMQKKIQGSQLQVIPKAGHLVNLEQPLEFQNILNDFLRTKF